VTPTIAVAAMVLAVAVGATCGVIWPTPAKAAVAAGIISALATGLLIAVAVSTA
jgi:hypothetical protein